jgi:methionyl aminopeptidase
MVTLKSPHELEKMRAAGRVVGRTLRDVADAATPGTTLAELDAIGAAGIAEHGARPSFLGYHPFHAPVPYPATLCLSVNDVIVHGIPDDRVLRAGDLLSIDCGAELDGYHGDAAVTVFVGDADEAAQLLVATAERALREAIGAAIVGGRLGDISHAVERVARAGGYGLPDGFGGHGIGTEMHEDPHLPNSGRPGRGLRLRAGLVLAIEPMLVESGDDGHRVLRDGWTITTTDGSRAAHVEHSVAITPDGPVVLTAA